MARIDPKAAERAAARARIDAGEDRIMEAVVEAMAVWLDAVRSLVLGQALSKKAAEYLTADGLPDLDQAKAANAAWARALAEHVEPAIAETFGEGFAAQARAADISPVHYQDRHMAEVFDRLKIWPEDAFEEIRPELQEALASNESIDQITDRVGRTLNIDAPSRTIRANISAIDAQLADPGDLSKAELAALRSEKRKLWGEHDESLQEWRWKARRIARTETQGAIEGGALASAEASAAELGEQMYKKWVATSDERTRKSHHIADGQIVPIGEKFRVGKSELDHPADPRGRAEEIINCRCTVQILDADEVGDEIAGKWGGRGVAPMSARLGPDLPEQIDQATELLSRELKDEVVDWPAQVPVKDRVFPAAPKVPAPASTVADVPAEFAAVVDAGEKRAAAAKRFTAAEGGEYGSKNWPYHRESGRHPFTEEERATVSTYSEYGYDRWSRVLRGTREATAEDLGNIARMESAINKANRVPDDIVVSRSLPAAGFEGTARADAASLVGREFIDPGFMSTSLRSVGEAEQILLTGDVPYTMRLTVPKDSRGLFVANTDRAGGQPLTRVGTSEQELILPPGGRYSVHRVEIPDDPEASVVVHATYADALDVKPPAGRPKRSEFAGRQLDDLVADMNKSIEEEDFDLFDRLAAEVDKRQAKNALDKARRDANRAAKEAEQSAKYEDALNRGLDDESAIEFAYGVSVDKQRRMAAISFLRSHGYQGRNLEELVADSFDDHVAEAYAKADDEIRGGSFFAKGMDDGRDPRSLWYGNETTARKYASEELKRFWDANGRVTKQELMAQYVDPAELRRIQANSRDFNQ